jgi:uncharacterized membrane protein YozB (DUF420 family)
MKAAGSLLIVLGVLIALFCLVLIGAQANACDTNCAVPLAFVAGCGGVTALSIVAGVWLIKRR